MMKEQALYNFFASFGIPAFERNSVPTGQGFPYLTYEIATGIFEQQISLSASLWYKDKEGYSALLESVKKKNELEASLSQGGKLLDCDSGKIWLMRGSPFAQVMGDDGDDKIKRQIINITAEYFTA